MSDSAARNSLSPHLHHVGIVLPTEEEAAALMSLLGLEEAHRGYVSQYEALCVFTRGNGGSPLEFVIPSGGVLTRFNQGRGGIHHIALAVDSLQGLAQELGGRGIRLLEAEPVQGAGPFLCNFLPPVYTRGLTVEFVEELTP